MKKLTCILLLLSFAITAQNVSIIKDTFYAHEVNGINQTAAENNIPPKEKIYLKVEFKADEKGQIFDILVPSKYTGFEQELVSIVSKIPTLNPEEYLHKGNIMRYELEMRIKLPSKNKRKKMLENAERFNIDFDRFVVLEYFPLKNIDISEYYEWTEKKFNQLPQTNNCESTMGNKEELMRCLSSEINSFVNRKFDVGLAAELGLSSGLFKVEVTFYISKEGEIVNVSAESPSPELSEEGIRVINSLPDFISPAMKDGKPIVLKYVMPIRFRIAE